MSLLWSCSSRLGLQHVVAHRNDVLSRVSTVWTHKKRHKQFDSDTGSTAALIKTFGQLKLLFTYCLYIFLEHGFTLS